MPILGAIVIDVMIKYSPLISEKIVFIPDAKVKVDLFISCAGLEPNGLIHSNIACKYTQSISKPEEKDIYIYMNKHTTYMYVTIE